MCTESIDLYCFWGEGWPLSFGMAPYVQAWVTLIVPTVRERILQLLSPPGLSFTLCPPSPISFEVQGSRCCTTTPVVSTSIEIRPGRVVLHGFHSSGGTFTT